MKDKPAVESRHHRLRDAYVRDLGGIGVFMEGTLSRVQRAGRKAPSWQLTFKQQGKTRTVYVPLELVPEVEAWTKAYRELKQLIRKVTAQNLAIIRRHGAVRRAASRGRRRTERTSGGTSRVS
jgi:hypothetical protein